MHFRRGGEERAQQSAPLHECIRFAEALHMRLHAGPPNQEEVIVSPFDAGAHFQLLKSVRGFDEFPRFDKRGLELLGLTGFDGEEGVFEDHSALLILAAMGSRLLGSTMARACIAISTPALRGMTWKWT